MSEPAPRNAAGPAPDDPERKPDPRAGGWADVRQIIIADSHLVAQASGMVAARPGDAIARAVLTLAIESFERAVAIGRRWQVDEAVMEAERERGFAAGYAACKAERRRLEVIPGGQPG